MFHMVLWSLLLALLPPACEGSSMGAVVHIVPLESSHGETVVAHFTAVAPDPCPVLTGVCAGGVNCTTYDTSLRLIGAQPSQGWCVRQWHQVVPSHYTATITLGSSVTFSVSVKATPTIRPNNGRLNQPPYVALPPPLRARKNCPHHFHLDVKDLDGDKVRCRFPAPEECPSCAQYTFIELDEEHCMVTFTGQASVGHYSLVVMVEDYYPAPKTYVLVNTQALSSVPVLMSLTVEQSSTPCSAEPVVSAPTPRDNAVIYILPYEQIDLTVSFTSQLESVSEIAVVGPPALFRSDLSTTGSTASMSLSWVRGLNTLAPLLPICFSANTHSLQSEPRCLWLYQKPAETLPAGTVLTCESAAMTLALPLTSLPNINLSELQLNSATCPVTINSTHLSAVIPLTGCGTKAVHAGNELVYTNKLQSVRAFTMVSRVPRLLLPLTCRIPGLKAHGPFYNLTMPTEEQTFGVFDFRMEFRIPDLRLRRDTQEAFDIWQLEPAEQVQLDQAERVQLDQSEQVQLDQSERVQLDQSEWELRVRRAVSSGFGNTTTTTPTTTANSGQGALGSRLKFLELHVMSNCTVNRAELLVEKCMQSETADMADATVLMDERQHSKNNIVKVLKSSSTHKVYKLDLSSLPTHGSSTMYLECTVCLCITMMPSQKCPKVCNEPSRSATNGVLNSVFSKAITFRSEAVSLVVTTTAAPTTAATVPVTTAATAGPPIPVAPATTTTPVTTTTPATTTTPSHAPQMAFNIRTGVLLVAMCIFLN